ncbi:MAG TPA: hypothetical protein DD381_11285 [Lentisphaeria bacterium]|nr:MAG: hypothetical protein A2W89_13525 [Bacteroidetes bacterium GWE2_42_39]HBM16912.1 hypothetical protein [Lentisphaeria bacterium]
MKKLKKLVLKKEIIANLTDDKMIVIQGGTSPGTGLACFTMIGDMMETNSDGPYFTECDFYSPVGDSDVILYGGCLITD